MRRRAADLATMGALRGGAVQANGLIDRTAAYAEVGASLLMWHSAGHMVLPLRAEFSVGDSMHRAGPPQGAEPIGGATALMPLHQHGDAGSTVVRSSDDNVACIVATLRRVESGPGAAHAPGGVLTVREVGARVVAFIEG